MQQPEENGAMSGPRVEILSFAGCPNAGAAYVLACRIYRSDEGASGLPRREWIAQALVR